MRPTAGVTFGGRYELVSRIAIGGMGEVWQATDSVIGRTVAIKILKDEYLGDPNFLERFRSEARHAALVNHEGIANVYDYGEEDGSAFLVMELVPGEALSTILERERVLPADTVLDIVAQTALALQAAHSAGLVHRDIKPGNLLITPDGRVKITDFGIARIADQVPLTATGQVMGTVQYLSPEQASGHPASPSTDIYSLGIVAYESLAGKRPFTGESQVAIAMAQINETPPPLPVTIADPVRNLVFSMIAKNPTDRPASAAHVARAAQALRHGDLATAAAAVPAIADGVTNTQATQILSATDAATTLLATASTQILGPDGTPIDPEDAEKKSKRSPWMWPLIALITVLLVVLGVIVWQLFAGGSDNPEPTPSATATASETPSAEPTPEPTEEAIAVVESEYLGKSGDEVVAALRALGLNPTLETGTPATASDKVNTVYKVAPTGNLAPGASVTVTQYGTVAEVPAPSSGPSIACADGVCTSGTEATISWSAFTRCPAGMSTTGYNLSVTGATLNQQFPGGIVSANVTSATMVLGAAPGPAQVSFTALCGEDQESPSSAVSKVTIQNPPAPTATAPATSDPEGEGAGDGATNTNGN